MSRTQPLPKRSTPAAREIGQKMLFPKTRILLPSRRQLCTYDNKKRPQVLRLRPFLKLVLSVNYKTSAQAGAATCQRQAQAFWFVQSFMSVYMIYVRPADVNRLPDLSSLVVGLLLQAFTHVQTIAQRG